jgi:hypothetical protein
MISHHPHCTRRTDARKTIIATIVAWVSCLNCNMLMAAGSTTGMAQILAIQPSTTAAWVLFDSAANNVNGCVNYAGSVAGASGYWFQITYAAGGPTEAQKVMLTLLAAAQASGKLINIYSGGCANGGTAGYNTIDSFYVKTN